MRLACESRIHRRMLDRTSYHMHDHAYYSLYLYFYRASDALSASSFVQSQHTTWCDDSLSHCLS